MEVQGSIKVIGEVQEISAKFKKRELLFYSAISDINKIRNIPKHYRDIKALTRLKINNFENMYQSFVIAIRPHC